MTITHSTVSGNLASYAGGVANFGTMTMTNSTVSGNSAFDDRGGVGNYDYGTMTMTNSTVSGNFAGDAFGGVLNFGTMTLSRTLISGNTGLFSEVTNFSGGTLNANDYNLFGSNGSGTNFTPGATDIVPASGVTVADILASLANNGGATFTHALVTGSPAIDAVTDGSCPPPAFDQRGVERSQDGDGDTVADCDIGSVEVGVFLCNGRVPTIRGTPGKDTIPGTNGRDVIHGLGGDDTISGLNGDDVICGGEGNDTLSGNNGNDRLFGEIGADTLNGDKGNDALNGGTDTNTDTCNGGSGSDTGTACETRTSIP